jgi:hypothetical protein
MLKVTISTTLEIDLPRELLALPTWARVNVFNELKERFCFECGDETWGRGCFCTRDE